MFKCKKCGSAKINLTIKDSTCHECGNDSFTITEMEKTAKTIEKFLTK